MNGGYEYCLDRVPPRKRFCNGPSDNPGVLCGIVTYNAQEHIQDSLEALSQAAPWSCPLCVVDNASMDGTLRLLKNWKSHNLKILELEKNMGVAVAYNLILEYARIIGAHWVFLLDQDSRCKPGCLDILYQNTQYLITSGEKVGAVCPTVYSGSFPEVLHLPYFWDGRHLHEVYSPGCQKIRVDSGISSGTLYRVEALDKIGGFREDFFIDFVDHECHLRLKENGWGMWWIKEAYLEQQLGIRQKMTTNGLWIEHSPFRYYYIARNMLEGLRIHGGYRAVLSFLIKIWSHTCKIWRYGLAPKKSMFYMIKGLWHGLLGRFGPL